MSTASNCRLAAGRGDQPRGTVSTADPKLVGGRPTAPGFGGRGRKGRPMRATKWLRGVGVAVATLITLCVACCCTSCSAAASRPSSAGLASTPCHPARPAGHRSASADRFAARSTQSGTRQVVSATRARQLWASTLPGGGWAEAGRPDGTRLFVLGAVKTHFETVAYSAATGAQLWAKAYQASTFSDPVAIAVSPDGARVYVTGNTRSAIGPGATVAYDARTGQQLWASRYEPKAAYGSSVDGLAVSPDGTTVYLAGDRRVSSRQSYAVVIAYAAATGQQRWLRYYTTVSSAAYFVAVSPDGKTVYVTGSGGSPWSVL